MKYIKYVLALFTGLFVSSSTMLAADGAVTVTAENSNPNPVCLGSPVSVSVSGTTTDPSDPNCEITITNKIWTWTASAGGNQVASQSNGGASWTFPWTPASCGNQTVTVTASVEFQGTNCNGGGYDKSFQGSADVTVKVIKVEITSSSSSGSVTINRCQDPNRTVTFSCDSTCAPGGVTWSISRATGTTTGDATIAGDGTVTIGSVPGTYTIKAVSRDDSDCYGTASLTVTRDCDCAHHTSSKNPITPVGGICRPTDSWPGSPITTDCNEIAKLYCDGSIHLDVNGTQVGHCPYPQTKLIAVVTKCKCGAVFMESAFTVVDIGPTDPTYGWGKNEEWTCENGFSRYCFTVDFKTHQQTARNCDPAEY